MRWTKKATATSAAAALVALTVPAAWAASSVQPVLSDLDGPRGLGVGRHGAVVFSESDGSVSKLITRGPDAGDVRQLTSVAPGLAPAVDMNSRGRVFILTGGGEPGPGVATLYRWYRGSGLKPMADIAAYQQRHPDPYDLEDFPGDSNPFGVQAVKGGSALVADAAGNEVLQVFRKGHIRSVAIVKPRIVRVPDALPDEGFPPAGTRIPSESVITSVAVGDGYWYFGELRGFPATPGKSQVWRVKAGTKNAVCDPEHPYRGACRRVADGFTSIVDLAVGPAGHIFVAELVKKSWLQWELEIAPPIGGIFEMSANGRNVKELGPGEFILPGGVEVGADGKIYAIGPIFGEGALSRIRR